MGVLFNDRASAFSTETEISETMRRQIMVLNLVNGLDLTSDQMEMILSYAKESEALRRQFQSTLLLSQSKLESTLEEIRAYLREKKEIPSSTKQEYHRLADEIKSTRLKMDEGVRSMALNIKERLKPHQVYQLEQFVPCIIPPKGELRIGQVDNHKSLAMKMERIRGLPSRVYERRKSWILSQTLRGLKLHAPRGTSIDEGEMRDHIQQIFDEARSLEDTEFEVQKEDLAQRLIFPIKRPETKNSLLRKIEGFLLCAEIIPILDERIVRGQES